VLESILAIDVPEDEVHLLAGFAEGLPINLYAYGGVIALGINAFDEPADQARLADGKSAEHADFLFEHEMRASLQGEREKKRL